MSSSCARANFVLNRTMTGNNDFQLSKTAAESYERQKVPAIFSPMADATLNAIVLPKEAMVLDLACGTGAVARAVAKRLPEPSHIAGADLNPDMIEIARRQTPECPHSFEWVAAPASALPFENARFDLAFCQQGLQFFPDKPAALAEARRVMQTDGRLVLTCWAAIPPFFKIVSEVLRRYIGEAAAAEAVVPFVWNDSNQTRSLISNAGFECRPASTLPITRIMAASKQAMREEILATPNETALRAAGDSVVDAIVTEILSAVAHFRKGEALAMPQEALLFEAIAR
jgi:ubiquinone/menaquinone biosynthesis C-methylase UbiE